MSHAKALGAFLVSVATASVAGCTGADRPIVGERAEAVVVQTVNPDNRVFYVEGSGDRAVVDVAVLKPSHRGNHNEKFRMKHGSPLTVVVQTASLPKGLAGTRDLALLVQFGAATDGSDRELVVWYQRGVPADTPLNFANLAVFHEQLWDSSVAPFFRIRLVDVALERNVETLEALNRIQKVGGALAAAIPNPIVNPVFSVATRAAGLILGNRENRVLLDYSVQFYAEEKAAAAPDAGISILRRGAFVLMGRPVGEDREYWRNAFRRDYVTNDVCRVVSAAPAAAAPGGGSAAGAQAGCAPVPTPFVQMAVMDTDIVIPSIVARRDRTLRDILTKAATDNLNGLEQAAGDLHSAALAFGRMRRLDLLRNTASLQDVVNAVREEKIGGVDLNDEDLKALMQKVETVSGCAFSGTAAVNEWWDKIGKNAAFAADGTFALVSKTAEGGGPKCS